MIGALARHETRRAGWPALTAVPAVVAGGALVVLLLAAKGGDPAVFVRFLLREVLPLAFGLVAAAIPAAEPCLEVQLSLPVPFVWTLARRAGLCGLGSAAGTSAVAVTAGLAGVWEPAHGLLGGQLTWLSPATALAGVGVAAFAVSGSTAGAGAVVAGLWLVQDLSAQWYGGRAWARPVYLFVDDDRSVPAPWWWANRLTLLGLGLLLTGLAAATLTVRQERIFTARLRDQGEDS